MFVLYFAFAFCYNSEKEAMYALINSDKNKIENVFSKLI